MQKVVTVVAKFIKDSKVYTDRHFQRWKWIISETEVKNDHYIHPDTDFYWSLEVLEQSSPFPRPAYREQLTCKLWKNYGMS
jgi:hypothetical protein